MATTSLPEQQPFTFTSPVLSETHEDVLEFDYESWIQQSKVTNCYSKHWLEDADAQAINRHHREMMLQAADDLPEEAYELSLRDLSELTLSRATATDEPAFSSSVRLGAARSPSNTKPWRKKTPSMDGAGFIIKLFMPSPTRAPGGGRKRRKSFSSSTVPTLRENSAPVNDSSMENAASGNRIDPSCTRSHSMARKNHRDTANRKSVGCYPFFNSSKYKVKRHLSI
ncbi:hypothetical protein BAE44_0006356 [Dichanthelium oligosanthes]|uniref:Uncharacterized protein n=1 Tax=Dichanthelium oligosanthes TaxID=888268 RepID=A0A1E5W5I3_9POAL|nr:hypothetical protein BAE44_0006356 [Dichanthelium oligosanthes]